MPERKQFSIHIQSVFLDISSYNSDNIFIHILFITEFHHNLIARLLSLRLLGLKLLDFWSGGVPACELWSVMASHFPCVPFLEAALILEAE